MKETSSNSNDLLQEEAAVSPPNQRTKNFVHVLIAHIFKMLGVSIDSIDQLLDDFGLYILLERIADQLARHPLIAFVSSVAIISVGLPFIVFLVFSIGIIVLTFFGFVIVEGTLITIASVMFFSFMGGALILLVLFGSVFMAGYMGFMQIYDFLYPQNMFAKFRQRPRQHHHHHHSHRINRINSRLLNGGTH